jgi:hypothetical protein
MPRLAVALSLLALALAAAPAGAREAGDAHGWGFRSPTGNIVCNSEQDAAGATVALVCVVLSASPSWGQRGWTLQLTGRPTVHTAVGDIEQDVPALAYRRSWQRAGLRCTSQPAGLTCRNAAGHGFFLSRQSQRRF